MLFLHCKCIALGYFSTCTMIMEDSVVMDHNDVGAILSVSSSWQISGCSFLNNTASTTGGSVFKLVGPANHISFTVSASIFAGNSVWKLVFVMY